GGGLCVAVSHEGETAATIAALAAARRQGASTALVTARSSSRGARQADVVVDTPVMDRSWCHTVGYIAPVLAGGLIAAELAGAPARWPPPRPASASRWGRSPPPTWPRVSMRLCWLAWSPHPACQRCSRACSVERSPSSS